MRAPTENRDFLAYQRDGSPDALARVFDAVAPRLLLLAAHLTADAAQAEDLVQTTFLHAIRDAAQYDGRQPVSSWLAGILSHRATDLRRRNQLRATEALGDEVSGSLDPVELAADRELFERITTAIDGLGEPYREIVVLRLVHGLEPQAMAHALGRPPGTVRMQLKRGLERLRRALPAHSTLGVLFVDGTRGLAAVREEVLARAAALAGASATSTAGILGGLVMKKALLAAAVVVAGLALYRALASAPEGPGRAPQPALAAAPATASGAHPAPLSSTSGSAEATTRRAPSPAVATPEPRLEVRVRFEVDGAAASGVNVYLRALDGAALGVERRTDADGTATFERIASGIHEVHLDRLEEPVRVDARATPVLDLRIPRGVHVTGRVVDLEGAGVPDAAVLRFNARHHDLLQLATRTDADGRFELRDVVDGAELLARAAGFQPSEVERVRGDEDGRARPTLELGALGRHVAGRVIDPAGEPAPFAWVAIAVDEDARDEPEGSSRPADDGSDEKPLDREALFVRADSGGCFDTREVPGGHAVLLARPLDATSDLVGWAAAWVHPEGLQDVTVQLQYGAQLVGTVRDERGAPVSGVAVEVEWEGTHALGQLEDDLGPWMTDRRTTTDENGAYELVGLLGGDWDLRVIGERERLLREERVVELGTRAEWNPVLARRAALAVRLLDPRGAPLAGWAVAANGFEGGGFGQHPTDADGRTRVPDLVADAPLQVSAFAPRSTGGFGRLPALVRDDVSIGPAELVIRLAPRELPNGSVHGRLVDARGDSLAGARVTLRRDGWLDGASSRTDAAGGFSFEALSAGDYRLHGPLAPRSTPQPALGAWTLQPGERLELGAVRAPACCPLVLEVENAPARLHVEIWNDGELCVYDERMLLHPRPGQPTVQLRLVLPAGSYRASLGTSEDAATAVSFVVGAHTSTVTVALP